jgi:four helix bundle protein
MRDHSKLKAFQKADDLVLSIYQITQSFPKDEIFCLTSQMRRAGISVASNIVEGCARESENDYLKFLDYAFGSLRELHYQFGLAIRLGYYLSKDVSDCESKFIETEMVLGALIRSLRKRR